MIIVMSPSATKEDIDKVESKLKSVGLQAHLSVGAERTIVGVIGDKKIIGNLEMNMLPGVEKTVRITEKYKLVSREFHPENTVVDVDGVKVGGEQLVVMAGPCSVESLEQLREAAQAVKAGGAQFLRGGAFKPRTSPYDFQGLAEDGLNLGEQLVEVESLCLGNFLEVDFAVDTLNNLNFQYRFFRHSAHSQFLRPFDFIFLTVALDDVAKFLSVAFSLPSSHTLNVLQFLQSDGIHSSHLLERGILENNVWWHMKFCCHFFTQVT